MSTYINIKAKSSGFVRVANVAIAAVVFLGLAYAGISYAANQGDGTEGNPYDLNDHERICHESSQGNYNAISPAVNSIFLSGNGGHAQDENDIVPSFWYTNEDDQVVFYEGLNWDAPGQAAWNHVDDKGRHDCGTPIAEPETGSITVEKTVVSTSTIPTPWSFSFTGLDGFSLTNADNSFTASDLEADNYTVAETLPLASGWVFEDLSCESDADGGADVSNDEGETDIDVNLRAGENVTCTYTNRYYAPDVPPGEGSLKIMKDTDNEAGDQVEFDFELDDVAFPDTILGNNADYETFPDLSVGSHTVEELAEAGWTFDSVTCSNLGDVEWNDYDAGSSSVVVNVADGDNITCVFTNTMDEVDDTTITINKSTNVESSQVFDFFLDGAEVAIANLMGGQTSGAIDVAPGQHSVEELGLVDWNLVDIDCFLEGSDVEITPDSEGEGQISFTLAEGDDIACTFYNESVPPRECSVTIVSDTSNTVDQKDDANAVLVSQPYHGAWTALVSGAAWIWGDDPVVAPNASTTYTFTKTFNWNGPVTSAVLDIASDNSYSVELNGAVIASDPTENNFGTADQVSVATEDIDQGVNTLKVTVENWPIGGDSNPAGALYKLVVSGSDADCDDIPPPPSGDDEDDDDDDDDNGGGGGGSSSRRGDDDDDDGEVLGDSTSGEVLGAQIALVPAGAPNTGAGGMTASGSSLGAILSLLGAFGLFAGRKQD